MLPEHHLAFVGCVLPEDLGRRTRAYDAAGSRFQLNFASGLHRYMPQHLRVLSAQPAVAFPRGDAPFVRRADHKLPNSDMELSLLPFMNVAGIKEFSIAASIFTELLAWQRQTPGARRTILVYNVFSPFSLSVLAAARMMNAKAVAVVADLPHGLYKFQSAHGLLERIDFAVQTRVIKKFDGLVALTRQISEDFAPDVPALIVEGGVDAGAVDVRPLAISTTAPICMFSGTLNRVNGVQLMLDAMTYLNDPATQLWLFGRGEMEEAVRAAADRDSRIKYFGSVPNAEVRSRQREATVLLNPRISTHAITPYTFPSKLLEYMSSGRPVLTTALPGIPPEYFDYIFRIDEETPAGLAAAIRALCAIDSQELAARARKAQDYVVREKSWDRQTARAHEFIDHLWSDN